MGFLAPILEAAAPSVIGSLVGGGVAHAAQAGSNAALSGLFAGNQLFQTGLEAQSMFAQQRLDLQSTLFDEAMDQQSENMREINTLRDVQMQQRKADDGITKKFIESIGQ